MTKRFLAMSNFCIDITARFDDVLLMAVEIAYLNHAKCVGYRIDPNLGMIFYWTTTDMNMDGFVPFPFEMDAPGLVSFVSKWLAQTDYGPEPDHDGSNSKGWRIYNVEEGKWHLNDQWQSMFAVQPVWAEHGK